MFSKAHIIRLAGLATLLFICGNVSAQDSAVPSGFLASAASGKFSGGDKNKSEAVYKNPEYANPEKYSERPVQITSGNLLLPGVLTYPKGKSDVPLVVLVHDAGPHDKDMTVGPNKPFRDIALGLAAHGVATLRYDNRTQMVGAANLAKTPGYTVQEEVIDDAVAAITFGRALSGIDKEKLYVLGYGFGGILAPRIAKSVPELNGIILMAAPARPVHDYLLDRIEYEFSISEDHKPSEFAEMNALRLQVGNVRSFSLSPNMPADSLPLGLPASYWLDLREYNQGYVARSLPQRIMILHPERDYHVTLKDLEMWQQGLHHRGKQYTPVLYSNLNHLLQEGKDESSPAEYLIPKNVPMYLIRNISTWVRFGL